MADTKITALTALTAADPANDVLPIVDVSDTTMAASGTTKKISVNNILGCSGTATLASATITGDLTVDTSTLKVLSSPNQVGIGTASPAAGSKLHVDGMIYGTNTVGAGLILFRTTDPTTQAASPYIKTPVTSGYSADAVYGFWYQNCGISNPAFESVAITTNASERYRIDSSGIATWSNVGGVAGTAMTLNSTGLGVGVVPSAGKFEVQESGTGAGIGGIFASTASGGGNPGFVFRTASTNRWSLSLTGSAGAESIRFYDINNSATRLLIDTSGNVISNVTGTAPTLATNSQMVFNLTSNTNLRISVRGTDGTTRTANITLA